jgi:hypothetical protein
MYLATTGVSSCGLAAGVETRMQFSGSLILLRSVWSV